MTPKMSAYPENTTFPELYHPAVSVCLHLNIDVHTQNINEKTGMPLNMMFGMDGAAAHPKVNLKWRAW